MDLGIITALVLIVIWAVVALGLSGPGWIHLLLTVGVAMLIWRVVIKGTSTKRG